MQIKVASPCKRDWSKMTGNDAVRFCGDCRMNVYNLSVLSQPELEQLVREREGRVCVRFFARPDGTVLTRDCPVGVTRKRKTWVVLLAAVAGLFITPLFARGESCPTGPDPTLSDAVRNLVHDVRVALGFASPRAPMHVMGKMMVVPPPAPAPVP